MQGPLHQRACDLLGITNDVTVDEPMIRRAYRIMVRAHHPDRFPREARPQQKERLVEINDAYQLLLAQIKSSRNHPRHESANHSVRPENHPPVSQERGVGLHRDPAYAYYKQGFIKYSEGAGGMLARGHLKITTDIRGLKRTVEALQAFERAHEYFRRVVDDHPESVWARDAEYRLYRIERFHHIYSRIRKNLKVRMNAQPTNDGAEFSA